MNLNGIKKYLLPGIAVVILCCGCKQNTLSRSRGQEQSHYNTRMSDTWSAVDGLGRTISDDGNYPALKENRTVGLFYFIWMGAHGYDRHTHVLPDEGVHFLNPSDTLSPYNISEMLRENPDNPAYGPVSAFHYWGEPYLGYYVSDDSWVIRKHGQMLSDAGVDVIILDVTNAHVYLPQVLKICEVFADMRRLGNHTPQIAFIINAHARNTLDKLYTNFYSKGLYPELWFRWKGKPLLLCPPEGLTPETEEFFTVRHSWFCSSWDWFGDGQDKWPWADIYPQQPGWHESPDVPEAIAVCAATHPTTNIGRSFSNGEQPPAGEQRPAEGIHFARQFERALEVDPEFIFITGWNEWVAMRFVDGAATEMLGKKISQGDTYFVDQYNEEYSRDIEPMRGGFADAYYYQMAHYIRRYKGVGALPEHRRTKKMNIDGDPAKWERITAVYYDDKGDTAPRDHHGWGKVGRYLDNSGRNDIIESRMSCDGQYLYAAAWTSQDITPHTDPVWMNLFLTVEGNDGPYWEGFGWRINAQPDADGTTVIERCNGGWDWEQAGDATYSVKGNFIEMAIPLDVLQTGPGPFTVEFKWIDNTAAYGDIQECMDKGDSAPNGRFRYRFRYKG